uniref:Uncharacterized protein n=1 Tax=Nelumbo nucifera TaxID=4432 RepID=A0A822XTS8_NELNU|nr:TPA_asm: hypothetical protein HUJ06_026488 [Nelumbo nucifera]
MADTLVEGTLEVEDMVDTLDMEEMVDTPVAVVTEEATADTVVVVAGGTMEAAADVAAPTSARRLTLRLKPTLKTKVSRALDWTLEWRLNTQYSILC